MYFFVDESGHTGANLFDENQPILNYGVLSAKTNLDVLAAPKVKKLGKSLASNACMRTSLVLADWSKLLMNWLKFKRNIALGSTSIGWRNRTTQLFAFLIKFLIKV